MSAIDFALRAAAQKLQQTTAKKVEYRRKSDGTKYAILATPSNPDKKNRDVFHGSAMVNNRTDWLLLADQLPFQPEPFDRIVDGEAEYEVAVPRESAKENCFRYMDTQKRMMRIHTQRG